MELTGKAKEEFLKWFDNDYMELSHEYDGVFNMPNTSLRALIIEWLDSVGIIIIISFGTISESWLYKIESDTDNFLPSRSEATKQAIIKANEIYNSKQ